MPVVLGSETWPVWLGEEPADHPFGAGSENADARRQAAGSGDAGAAAPIGIAHAEDTGAGAVADSIDTVGAIGTVGIARTGCSEHADGTLRR